MPVLDIAVRLVGRLLTLIMLQPMLGRDKEEFAVKAILCRERDAGHAPVGIEVAEIGHIARAAVGRLPHEHRLITGQTGQQRERHRDRRA